MDCQLKVSDLLNATKYILSLLNLKSPIRKNLNVELTATGGYLKLATYHRQVAYGVIKIPAQIQVNSQINILATELKTLTDKLKTIKIELVKLTIDQDYLIVTHDTLGSLKFKLYYQPLPKPKIKFKTASLKNLTDLNSILELINHHAAPGLLTLTTKQASYYQRLESGIHLFGRKTLTESLSNLEFYFEQSQINALKNFSGLPKVLKIHQEALCLSDSERGLYIYNAINQNKQQNLQEFLASNSELVQDLIQVTVLGQELKNALYWQNQNDIQKSLKLKFTNQSLAVSSNQATKKSQVAYQQLIQVTQDIVFTLSSTSIEKLASLICTKEVKLTIKAITIEQTQINLLVMAYDDYQMMIYDRLVLA